MVFKRKIKPVQSEPLEELCPPVVTVTSNTGCHIELTLNYPRTAVFIQLSSEHQKALYKKLYHKVLHTFGLQAIVSDIYTFEYCKSGHVHLHASIVYTFGHKFFIRGVIADIVKKYLNELPKKYCKYMDSSMDTKYDKYKCPSICVQYNSVECMDRIECWNAYIQKHQ